MITNYFKTAWRNIVKSKAFSIINVAGLSLGMAACLLILQYVSFELSFDQFNKNSADIYRVYNDRYQNGKLIQHGTITYSAIGKAMQDDYPEVTEHARVEPFGKNIIIHGDKKIADQEVLAVDNTFLDMFSYPFLAGDPLTALREPYTVVLTERAAGKIFDLQTKDWQSLLGQVITMGTDSMGYKITGICLNPPENSHLQFDYLASYTSMLAGKNQYKEADYDFKDSDFWHYIKLKQGTDYKALESKLEAFSQRHFQGNKVSGSVEKFYLQPLSRAHLYSDFEYEIGITGSATVVWGLLIIAMLIIIIAWVNYINLATAKSMERAREVGVRKVAGATRSQLIRQFLTESVLINLVALTIAFVIVLIAQSGFNRLIGHDLSLSYLFQKGQSGFHMTFALSMLVVTGIVVSGFYPAFVLSSFKPILVLKGKFAGSNKGIWLRKALVIGQFAITIILIIGSLVVYKQIQFVTGQRLGIDISQMLMVRAPQLTNWDSTFIGKEHSFAEELKNIPGVQGTAMSGRIAGEEMGRTFNIHRIGADPSVKLTMRFNQVGLGYMELYGLKILAGRSYGASDFNPDFSKLHNIVLTESATKLLGFTSPKAAIGSQMFFWRKTWDIIGVVNDYHQKSLRYPMEPTVMVPVYSTYNTISVKVNTADLKSTVGAIKKEYDRFFPGNIFDYFFLDQKFNQLYADDELFGKVFAIFSGFAIFIACLGLLGLSLFATTQRTKEIGVRKVLGASVSSIVVLFSKDFILLVLVSFVLATPAAWYIMHRWLENFAYRTDISWWIFLSAGLLSVVIALGTISFQAVKAAAANPVQSLRSE
jgi:putative ABC transport system permease protein